MIIGVFGDGQLGQMMALAGIPLGHRFRFLGSDQHGPASSVGQWFDVNDAASRAAFLHGCDVLSTETENVPEHILNEFAASGIPFRPDAKAVSHSQDRLIEKSLFRSLGIPTPKFLAIQSEHDLELAADSMGLPLVIKTTRLGYDGKGQKWLRDKNDVKEVWALLGNAAPLIAEQAIPFARELSVVAVRSTSGDKRCYPLAENHHAHGILRVSVAPAPRLRPETEKAAFDYATRLLTHLDYVGVMALELFEMADGSLLANEMAPRVHNSGHWSQLGAEVSQFENHVRAITGMALGNTQASRPTAMVNVIGKHHDLAALAGQSGLQIHRYGKTEREARKLGHINLYAENYQDLNARVQALTPWLPDEPVRLTEE